MTIPWLFLIASLVGAAFTAAALVPARKLYIAVIPYFFMSWLGAELALHHIAWQAVATLGFIWAGALADWPGWVGLGLTGLSWAGLVRLHRIAHEAGPVFTSALAEGLLPVGDVGDAPASSRGGGGSPMRSVTEFRINPFVSRHPAVERIADLPYGEHGKRNLLDIYRPVGGRSGCPTLLQIHGGGWTIGHKREQALPLMHHMAERGWVCFAPNYRLSPKATFPDHLVDVKRALAWIREHGAEYGADPNFVVVTGGSAGGHLTALMALTANRPEFQPGFEDADTSVAAAVPFYGVYDFLERHGARGDQAMRPFLEKMILKCSPEDNPELWSAASPLDFVGSHAPPFLVLHGTHDALAYIECARIFVEKLRAESKQPVVYAEIPGAQHAFDIFHSVRTGYTIEAIDHFVHDVYERYRNRRDLSEGTGMDAGQVA